MILVTLEIPACCFWPEPLTGMECKALLCLCLLPAASINLSGLGRTLSTVLPLCSGLLLLPDAFPLAVSLFPSRIPSFNLYPSLPSIFHSICRIFNIIVVFLSHLPRIHVPVGISQSPLSCPYLVLNWGGAGPLDFGANEG